MIYVDTSVVVALLTVEPATEAVTAWFAGLRQMPISSDWLLTEFSSAIAMKLRSKQLGEADARLVRREFDVLSSSGLRLAPVSRAAFTAAAAMLQLHQHGLRSGDSLHLAVAAEVGARQIATLDKVMAKNARRLRMSVVAI